MTEHPGPRTRKDRHIAVVPVSWDIIEETLLPPGSRLRDATFSFLTMTIDLVVEHPELRAVSEGEVVPKVDMLWTTETVPGWTKITRRFG